MKTIKLKNLAGPHLIGDTHHDNGDVVMVPDDVGREYLKLGLADPADGQAVHNAPNHLQDAISPMPPDGHVATTLDNTPQYKKDQAPGLKELDRAFNAGAPARAAKPDPIPANPPAKVSK